MKKLLLLLLIAAPLHAQSRFLVGPSFAHSFDNTSLGISGSIEIPIVSRLELDAANNFEPLEAHVALGSGVANESTLGGIAWITTNWGLQSNVDYSWYSVTAARKAAWYGEAGAERRAIIAGFPTRFGFGYVRQFKNGISPNGTETSHLEGGEFSFTTRIGCASAFCFRLNEAFQFGKVLTQSNPVCDGTYTGPVTCPRSGAFGGGVSGGLMLEFPRRKNSEMEKF